MILVNLDAESFKYLLYGGADGYLYHNRLFYIAADRQPFHCYGLGVAYCAPEIVHSLNVVDYYSDGYRQTRGSNKATERLVYKCDLITKGINVGKHPYGDTRVNFFTILEAESLSGVRLHCKNGTGYAGALEHGLYTGENR